MAKLTLGVPSSWVVLPSVGTTSGIWVPASMEKPGHLLGADSSGEQFLHEGKEGVERGTDVSAGRRQAWAMCSCPKRGESQTTVPPAIPPPSPGTALNTEGSTKGELVWGASPHLDASFQVLPLPTQAQLLGGTSNVLPHANNCRLVEGRPWLGTWSIYPSFQ